jgi:adenylate cyclase
MTSLEAPKERLAAILAADVVGYTKLMHYDEHATIATLDEYRQLWRESIETHGGRIVDMAGDSVLAVFETATGAVTAATDVQREVVVRNEALAEERKMFFRVGINLGDIIEKGDGSVYGDGVNVAARLEATADPGGVNISGSVFESVHNRVNAAFSFVGEKQLKNVSDPVSVYQLGRSEERRAGRRDQRLVFNRPGGDDAKPTILVEPLKIISGDAEIEALAQALRSDIADSLTKQSAINVIVTRPETPPEEAGAHRADFLLEGGIRSSGEKLRFFFTLFDSRNGRQVWSERYSRLMDDIFDLEDEITLNVTSAVRLRIKAREFEQLREADDQTLSVGQLLSKAAGFFVTSHGLNGLARAALARALQIEPDHAMALAMQVFCAYREAEFSALEPSSSDKDDMVKTVMRAVAVDPSSFFAHLIASVVQQDLLGNFDSARVHAETSLVLNSGFSQASAQGGITSFHLGKQERGIKDLQEAIAAVPEDPHRFRHFRELAMMHFVLGDMDESVLVLHRLVHQAPELRRNLPLLAAAQWHAGQNERATATMHSALEQTPGLTRVTVRKIHFMDRDIKDKFISGLVAAGLPVS